MATKNPGLSLDAESNAILYEGANLSQLGILFKIDHRVLKERIHGLQPVGKRNGHDIFDIAEVSQRMVRLTDEQVDKAMLRLNHSDLPKTLSKEYWAGKRSKQDYLLKKGNLWETEKVVEVLGELFKTLKMNIDLAVDGVDRIAELTDRQRDALINLLDGAKQSMLETVQKVFAETEEANDKKPVVQMDWEDGEL